MENEEINVEKQENQMLDSSTEQPTVEAPNSMVNPTTPKIETTITNDQLNQIISKVDHLANQQAMIFAQMQQKKDEESEVDDDVIKY